MKVSIFFKVQKFPLRRKVGRSEYWRVVERRRIPPPEDVWMLSLSLSLLRCKGFLISPPFLSVSVSLEAHEHDPGILHGRLDGAKEGDGFAAVHQAVVVGEGNVHHGPDHHLSIPDDRSLKNTVHAEDG